MEKRIEEKLAGSLTAETTELLPFLPYLLQDFWELGIDPDAVAELIQKHIPVSERTRVLDLACGKGAVSVKLAARLGVQTKGVDLLPEFIGYAEQKAREFRVEGLCEFAVGDINEAVATHAGYDCVVFGAVGNVLGDRAETLHKLKATVKPGGYLLLDNYDFLSEPEWSALFEETGLELIDAVLDDGGANNGRSDTFRLVSDSKLGMAALTKRANELIEKFPDKKTLFAGYIRSQQKEYDDIGNQSSLVDVTWILKKPAVGRGE